MKLYTSEFPPVHIPNSSIYTHLYPEKDHHSESLPAYIEADSGRVLTRGDVRRLTRDYAWGLRNVLSSRGGTRLQRGNTVMIFSPNSLAYPFLLAGSLAAGLKITLANSAYTPAELAHQFTDSKSVLIMAHPQLLPVVIKMFEYLKVGKNEAKKRILIIGWNLSDKGPAGFLQVDDILGKGLLVPEEKFDGPDSNETAVLCYSSGTTGKPKGVETTHKNMCSVLNMQISLLDLYDTDVVIGVIPFYHIYGVTNLLLYSYYRGAAVVIMNAFEPVSFCKYIESYKVTVGVVVPPIFVVLARHPAVEKYSMKSLRVLLSAAAPLRAPLMKAVSDRLVTLGTQPAICQGFGLTELSPTTHVMPPEFANFKVGSVGKLAPNLEVRLVDDDEQDVKEGEPGELWVRGPTVMKGYLNNPTATKNSITEDGFFKTGDIGVIDNEGFYYIVDRKKELIKYKGFQVPPAELEAVLLQHPDIADAGVIGVESVAEATELPRAYVVSVKPLSSEAEKKAFAKSVQTWIQGQVARHKFLRGGVVVLDAIPKSAAGKILRRELRDLAKTEVIDDLPKAKL